ncbi:protein spire homolog 2 isoform X3 [Scophthalmus maximus]|uniref:protein spire homolog 2 isoform X3 n=1 Tax=Scophthalmus maximus TaxID=52904 RepID=UPI001FA873F7|nr:protein spire homolog 2 isoform X3 [Scophthalmus maximus]
MARSSSSSSAGGGPRLTAPTADRGEAARDLSEPRELSLEEVLKSYEQPINEEQAWAVCHQCCGGLRAGGLGRVKDPSSILLRRDGTVWLRREPALCDDTDGRRPPPTAERQLVQSLGVAIYRALDWGLDDSEERELSPQLERLIERMAGGAGPGGEGGRTAANGTTDEGYSGQDEEEEEEQEEEGVMMRPVCTFRQVMAMCASRLANPGLAPEHYQAVCRALVVETLELQTFLIKIRDAKEMLKKITTEEAQEDRSTAELDALKHTDWARLWVQLMKDLRQGVKLKKVQEQPFNTLPTEFSLTPFEMLMQDIRTRKFQLRKVMVDGDIPTRVKRNAHEMILDFIRSRPPLKPVTERSLPPPPPQQPCLHDQVLAEIKQERKLRPVDPSSCRPFGSLPCLAHMCPCRVKSTSCIDLSTSESGPRPASRPRVLLRAPTLAEMEEMNISEEEESPDSGELKRTASSPTPLKRDRSFSEHDLALLRGEMLPSLSESAHLDGAVRLRGERPRSRTLTGGGPPPYFRVSLQQEEELESSDTSYPSSGWAPSSPARLSLSSVDETTEALEATSGSRAAAEHQWMEEFSHPVESLALTVDEVINVRRVLVKAEMEKFLQSKELYNNLRRGKVTEEETRRRRSVCASCSAKMKIPSKKLAHIPVYTVGFHSAPKSHGHKSQVYKSLRSLSRRSVEEEFPHLYAHGCTLRDICADCTKFVADVISSSRRSVDILNNTPKREAKAAAAQRPQLQRQSQLGVCPQTDPPPTPPHRRPEQQQRLHATSPPPSPQLHTDTVNNVNQ